MSGCVCIDDRGLNRLTREIGVIFEDIVERFSVLKPAQDRQRP
jgi:hypothetical protein